MANEISVADLPAEMLNLEAADWESAGQTPAGKVGFTIKVAALAAGKTNAGVIFPRADLEILITSRPDRKVSASGERHWERMRLDGSFLKKFKSLVQGAGVKVPAGQKLSLAEVIKSLPGRPVFGVIQHREWKGSDGTANISAELGNRFGKSFADLG